MAAADPLANLGLQDADLEALLQLDGDASIDPLAWLTDETSNGSPLAGLGGGELSPTHVLEPVFPLPAQPLSAAISSEAAKKAAQHERVKAKNRRAQNKYREKQKQKFKDTEQQVEEMGVELERLRMENAALAQRQDVMERVLTVRDDAVGMLQAGRGSAPVAAAPAAPLQQRPIITPAESDSSAGSAPSPAASSGAGAASGSGGDAAVSGDGSGAASGCGADGAKGAVCVFSEGGVCTSRELNRLGPEDLERLRNMGPEEVQAQWRGIVQRLSDVLAATRYLEREDGDLDSLDDALKEHVQPILGEASMVCFEHAVYNPTNVQLLLTRALDDGKSGASAESIHKWAAVVAALRLRPEQRQQMAAFREVFMRRMCRVLGERRALFARLGELNSPEGLQAMRSTTEMWLKTHAATQELEANMQQEHVVGMEFLASVMGRVLDNTQKAVVIVQSWPFFPDVYSICTAAIAPGGHPLRLEAACCEEEGRAE